MTRYFAILGLVVAAMFVAGHAPAQQGLGQRIGKKIDQGLNELGSDLRRGWASVRQSVDKLGVQGRVYGRLRWDKALAEAAIDVQVPQEGIVVLKGSVPSAAARQKAIGLARDTVGVKEVTDELAVAAPENSTPAQPAPGN